MKVKDSHILGDNVPSAVAIALGASLGALLRWKLGEFFNPFFPTLPLGTLIVNLIGAFVMGGLLFITVEHTFLSHTIRLGLITGFLGSLTTFSTFSAEALSLFSKQEFSWLTCLIGLHVGGSIFMAAAGYVIFKRIFHFIGG